MRPEFERAAKAGDVRRLEAQLDAGEEISSRDRYGQTALMLAAHAGVSTPCKASSGAVPT